SRPPLHCSPSHPPLHSFPTRRSSDLKYPSNSSRWSATHSARLTPSTAGVITNGISWSPTVFVSTSCATSTAFRLILPRLGACRRSEEHTSELQSPDHLVCRLLLEKKT